MGSQNFCRTCLSVAVLLASTPIAQAGHHGESAEKVSPELVQEALRQEAKGQIKALAMQLQGALQGAMKAGGPVAAVEACHGQAPGITAGQSEGRWQIRRTSAKVRNPDNQPDAWEADVLQRFEQQVKEGQPVTDLVYSEVMTVAGEQHFRLMKAIPVQPVCLGCHGDDAAMKPELKQTIQSLYPNDQATGYKAGDLRGAFSLTRILD